MFCALLFLLCIPGAVICEVQHEKSLASMEHPNMPSYPKNKYRLSQRKCLEYLWEMNNRLEDLKRIDDYPNSDKVELGREKPADYPHMGAVGWWSISDRSWKFLCGSSLISPKFVLTAAHCTFIPSLQFSQTTPSIVRFGNLDKEDTETPILPVDVAIKRIITEPHYVSPYKYFDIALLELDTELSFSKIIQPACLWGTKSYKGFKSPITSTGWSVNSTDTLTLDHLKVSVMNILSPAFCNKLLRPYCNRNWCRVKSHQICARNCKNSPDVCTGDSGGPLQYRLTKITEEGSMHMIVGVTSFGMSAQSCGQVSTPGIYTKVSSFIDWIESVVWPGE